MRLLVREERGVYDGQHKKRIFPATLICSNSEISPNSPTAPKIQIPPRSIQHSNHKIQFKFIQKWSEEDPIEVVLR